MMTSILTACDKKPATTDPDTQQEPGKDSSDPTVSDDKPGKKPEEGNGKYQTLAERNGFGYIATYSKLEQDFEWAYNPKLMADGRIMLQATSNSEEEGYKENYITMNPDGTDIQYLPLPEFGENEHMQSYCLTSDGMWAVTYEWISGSNPASGGDIVLYDSVTADAPVAEIPIGGASTVTEIPVTEPSEEEAADDVASESDDDWMNSNAGGEDWTGDTDDDTTADDAADNTTTDADTPAEEEDPWIDFDDGENEEPEVHESYEIYRLYKIDMKGNIVAQPDITEITESQDYFYVQFMFADDEDNLYLSCEQTIFKIDSTGKLVDTLVLETWINQGFMLNDGNIMITYYGDTGMQVCQLNTDKMELEEPMTFDDDSWYNYIVGGGSYDIYLDDDNVLYGFDMETGKKTPLLNWMDSDVDRYSSNGYVIVDESTILFLYQEDDGGLELGTLKRVPYSEIPVRETITIGGYYLNYDIRRLISKFNRTNSTYRISFIDYSEYNTEEAADGAMNRLNMEMSAGNGPDILMDSVLNNMDLYVNKGFLVDLYTLMGENSNYQKEDLVQGYRNASEINGGLYSLAPSFSINAFWTNAEYLGDDGVLSLDELIAACKALPEDGVITSYATRGQMLQVVLMTSYNDLIDMETGECHFDTPEFAKFLEFCNLFPAEIDWETYQYDYSGSYNRIRNKEQIFEEMYLYSLRDMNSTIAQMGGMDGLACVGYPSLNGTRVILQTNNALAINASSKYQDVCWDFISQLLSDEYQESYASWELSVRQDLLEKQALEATQKPYYYDEEGNKVEYDQSWWDSETGEETVLEPLTQEQVDYFISIINSVSGSYRMDEELLTVVSEEAGAYFAGQKPAEEVARLIQNRVWTYVNEQR